MRTYTAHLRQHQSPELVREGFSWGAAIFGPLWLLAHRAWIPAALVLLACAIVAAFTHGVLFDVLWLGIAWTMGLCGQDLRRWNLALRGYGIAHVIAARDEDSAYGRLLAARPDLLTGAAP
jgi:hypothetical protein